MSLEISQVASEGGDEQERLDLPTSEDPLECALAYRALGFHPVFTEGKVPKHLTGWQEKELDELEIRAWFARFKGKRPNVGIAPRRLRGKWLAAIDVDSPERLHYLESKLCQLPRTLMGRSARGIRAFYTIPSEYDAHALKNITYLRLPGEARPSGRVEGVDVKTAGGQVIVWPSIHETGVQYTWIDNLAPVDLPPEWVSIILSPVAESDIRAPAETRAYQKAARYTPKDFPQHTRDFRDVNKFLDKQLRNQCRAIVQTGEGIRNDTLFRGAFCVFAWMYDLKLDSNYQTLRNELTRVALTTGLDAREISKALDSANKRAKLAARAPYLREVEDETPDAAPEPEIPGADDAPPPAYTPADFAPWAYALKSLHGSMVVDVENVALAFELDPALGGGVRHDKFSRTTRWVSLPQFLASKDRGEHPLDWRDGDELAVMSHLSRSKDYDWDGVSSKDLVRDACDLSASRNSYDSLRDFVGSLPAWDGVERVSSLFVDYFRCDDIQAYRIIAKRFLVSAMARALSEKPVPIDGALVLFGDQGVGKDTFYDILFDGFVSHPPGNQPISSKDSIIALSKTWLCHDSEMAACRATKSLDDADPLAGVKAVITQTYDEVRVPYGRAVERRYRRAILAFSTNTRELVQVGDPSRRFWPVAVGRLLRDELARDRLQILAEAKALYTAGEPWWVAGETEEWDVIASVRADHVDSDPWEDDIAARMDEFAITIGNQIRISSRVLLCQVLGLDAARRDVRAMKRLKRIMLTRGWMCSGATRMAVAPGHRDSDVYEKNVFFKDIK